jgi:hypothetical protein
MSVTPLLQKVAADPFGNILVLVDLSKGRYATASTGNVTGVNP